jgi:surface polysaccharide O-acyltransferase-like enzyme
VRRAGEGKGGLAVLGCIKVEGDLVMCIYIFHKPIKYMILFLLEINNIPRHQLVTLVFFGEPT